MNDLNHTDTARLISRSREGDSVAIEDLIHSHEARIYRLALSILNDPAEADEATQDAFVTAIKPPSPSPTPLPTFTPTP